MVRGGDHAAGKKTTSPLHSNGVEMRSQGPSKSTRNSNRSFKENEKNSSSSSDSDDDSDDDRQNCGHGDAAAGTAGTHTVADADANADNSTTRGSLWSQRRSGRHHSVVNDQQFQELTTKTAELDNILHSSAKINGNHHLLLNWTGVWSEMFPSDRMLDKSWRAQRTRSVLSSKQTIDDIERARSASTDTIIPSDRIFTVLGRQSPLLVVLLNIFFHPYVLSFTILLYLFSIMFEASQNVKHGNFIAFFGYLQGLIGVILASFALKGSLFGRVRLYEKLCYCQNIANSNINASNINFTASVDNITAANSSIITTADANNSDNVRSPITSTSSNSKDGVGRSVSSTAEKPEKVFRECIICLSDAHAEEDGSCCCWRGNCSSKNHFKRCCGCCWPGSCCAKDEVKRSINVWAGSNDITAALMRWETKRCFYFLHSLEKFESMFFTLYSHCKEKAAAATAKDDSEEHTVLLPTRITSNDLPKPVGLYHLLERVTLFGDEMRHPEIRSAENTIAQTHTSSGVRISRSAVDEQIMKFGKAPSQILMLSLFIVSVYFLYIFLIHLINQTWCTGSVGDNSFFCDNYTQKRDQPAVHVLIAASNSMGATTLIVALMALFYAAQLCHEQVRQWMKRYLPCRRTDLDKDLEMKSKQSRQIKRLRLELQRDAQERYLLIQYYAKSISQLFATFLAEDIAARTAILVLCYWQIVKQVTEDSRGLGAISQVLGWIVAYQCFALIFDVLCVSYGNNVNWLLENYFTDAGNSDYRLIGGRSEWLEYIKETQIRWEIAQYQVTYTSLTSVIGSLLTAGVSTLVIAQFSSGSSSDEGDSND